MRENRESHALTAELRLRTTASAVDSVQVLSLRDLGSGSPPTDLASAARHIAATWEAKDLRSRAEWFIEAREQLLWAHAWLDRGPSFSRSSWTVVDGLERSRQALLAEGMLIASIFRHDLPVRAHEAAAKVQIAIATEPEAPQRRPFWRNEVAVGAPTSQELAFAMCARDSAEDAVTALTRELARAGVSDARAAAALVLKSPLEIMIVGPSGSGKSSLAKGIALISKKPFVHLDCGALGDDLVESELFGHERGAFTGALKERAGAFERANRGVLFLDEIQHLSGRGKQGLLVALQDRTFRRVGSDEVRRSDFRLISATTWTKETVTALMKEAFWGRVIGHIISLPSWADRSSSDRRSILEELVRRASTDRNPANTERLRALVFSTFDKPLRVDGDIRRIEKAVLKTSVWMEDGVPVDEAMLMMDLSAAAPKPAVLVGPPSRGTNTLVDVFRDLPGQKPTQGELARAAYPPAFAESEHAAEVLVARELKRAGLSIKDLERWRRAGTL